jgi:opacity protein-like surface antigen
MRRTLALLVAMSFTPALCAAVFAQAISVNPAPTRKVRLLANVNYSLTERSFDETSTFTSFLEEGSLSQSYIGGTGIGFEIGGIYSITPSVGILGSFELSTTDHDAMFEVEVPHPLLFNQNRSVSGELPGLTHSEQAVNVDGVYTARSGSIVVDVFGGATLFFTETELLDEATTSSVYPFDELVLAGTTTVELTDNPIGFNVGAAFTYEITSVVGVSFQARYSAATATLERDNGSTVDIDVGGIRVGGGIRIAF